MNPTNPNEVPPMAPQPQVGPQPVAPAPVAQPFGQPQPVSPVAAPLPPQPAVAMPQPPQQAFGAGVPVSPVMPAPAPKSSKKLIILIAAIVAGLAVIGVGIWVLMTFVFGGLSLETYKGDTYSVLVPKDYEKESSAGDGVSYVEPRNDKNEAEKDSTTQSRMAVSSTSLSDSTFMSRDDLIKLYDTSITEDGVKGMTGVGSDASSGEVKNFKKTSNKYQGFEARQVSFDAYKDGKKTGEVQMLVVFTEKHFYSVATAAHVGDSAFTKSASKMINSLKIEE